MIQKVSANQCVSNQEQFHKATQARAGEWAVKLGPPFIEILMAMYGHMVP